MQNQLDALLADSSYQYPVQCTAQHISALEDSLNDTTSCPPYACPLIHIPNFLIYGPCYMPASLYLHHLSALPTHRIVLLPAMSSTVQIKFIDWCHYDGINDGSLNYSAEYQNSLQHYIQYRCQRLPPETVAACISAAMVYHAVVPFHKLWETQAPQLAQAWYVPFQHVQNTTKIWEDSWRPPNRYTCYLIGETELACTSLADVCVDLACRVTDRGCSACNGVNHWRASQDCLRAINFLAPIAQYWMDRTSSQAAQQELMRLNFDGQHLPTAAIQAIMAHTYPPGTEPGLGFSSGEAFMFQRALARHLPKDHTLMHQLTAYASISREAIPLCTTPDTHNLIKEKWWRLQTKGRALGMHQILSMPIPSAPVPEPTITCTVRQLKRLRNYAMGIQSLSSVLMVLGWHFDNSEMLFTGLGVATACYLMQSALLLGMHLKQHRH